ncbi:MAG TPA: T9SS type A sorting domain-containing protein [Bacteroidales bacterium]|nr:T9SS type A sorting domain-containing protein [Bacteroidales bacterium]
MKKNILIVLLLVSLNGFSQNVLKIGEVFDFEIGDEFHYKSFVGTPSGERLKVIEKCYSENKDTVYYKFEVNKYMSSYVSDPEPHLIYSYYSFEQSKSFSHLDSSIFTTFLDCKFYDENDVYCRFDSIISYSTKWCGLEINGYDATVGEFEPSRYIHTCGKGVGDVRVYLQFGSSGGIVDEDKELVYYKKGDQMCGEPDLTSIPLNNNTSKIAKIYPNPTSSLITIKLNEPSTDHFIFEIINIQGKIIHHQEIQGTSCQYDLSGIEKGIYVVKIYISGNILYKKVIKY